MFFFSDLQENAKNNSKNINVVNAIVLDLSKSDVEKYSKENNPKTIIVEIIVVRIINPLVPAKIVSFGDLGFLFIIPFSAGSIPKAKAGNPSVTKLIHKICKGNKGRGNENNKEKNITEISPKLADNRNLTNFLILS